MPYKTSENAAKKSSKAQNNISKSDKKKRKDSYALYIYQLHNKVQPDISISSKAMSIMNTFVKCIIERIVADASLLALDNKGNITRREVRSSVRLLLPGELADQAVRAGTKAIRKVGGCL